MTTHQPDRFPVVALGASAGGLKAFEDFFRHLPASTGMAFVLIQHLDPEHPSMLVEIVQRFTQMPVLQACDGMRLQPDRVHVMPPNCDMTLQGGLLRLREPAAPHGLRMPIDGFFRSLAQDAGEWAMGVVLSGGGSDGMLGLRDIRGAGGWCLAQEPTSAQCDSMPASAVRSGEVHRVALAQDLPRHLVSLAGSGRQGTAPHEQASGETAWASMARIMTLLKATTGHDFSRYKKGTIVRRIERRMALHGLNEVPAYADFMEAQPLEQRLLFKELLIHVTSFFRDPEVFDLLKRKVLPGLVAANAAPGGSGAVRVWVAGCATGEEAYSIAMLLAEVLGPSSHKLAVQIFSTDIDEDAIATARAGLYPPNIVQDVSAERLARFFTKEEAGYRIRKEVRERVVFAVQSVIKDPPFTRLDLLLCRNVLIYLDGEAQARLIPLFHYALRPGGVLVLSPSESVGHHGDLFACLDRKWKVYRALPNASHPRTVLDFATGAGWAVPFVGASAQENPGLATSPTFSGSPLADLAQRALLQSFAPAAVLCDLQGRVLFVHGEIGRFLRPPPGQPSQQLLAMAGDELQSVLREATDLAVHHGRSTLNREVRLAGLAPCVVGVSVRIVPSSPLAVGMPAGQGSSGGAVPADGLGQALLVSFQEQPSALAVASADGGAPATAGAGAAPIEDPAVGEAQPGADAGRRVQALEHELVRVRTDLASMLEEQQASGEELRSANEELQSTNEELQSVNEELVTVNAELQTKIEQMSGMQDDMKNLLENIRIGTIFLDRKLLIRRFTRDATRVYRLVPADVGRPLADIRSELQGDDLLRDAQTVLDTLVSFEREVCTASGTWYLARIQPYRTTDNVIDGVVLTFADVTEQVQSLALRKARNLAEAIVDAVPSPLVVLDAALNIVSTNRAYHLCHGGSPGEVAGRSLFEVGGGRWNVPPLRDLLEHRLPQEQGAEPLVLPGDRGPATEFSARHVKGERHDGDLVLLSIREIRHTPA